MEGGLGFQVNSIDADRLTAYLEKGKIPIWDGVAVTTYQSFPLLSLFFAVEEAKPSGMLFQLFKCG